MKPRIDFEYCDASWIRPVSSDVSADIEKYFKENPDYKDRFESAEVKLRPSITNCWIDLPEEKEDEFRALLLKLPREYTMDKFWEIAKKYKQYVSNPKTKYLLNFTSYPWYLDKKANTVFTGCELIKN